MSSTPVKSRSTEDLFQSGTNTPIPDDLHLTYPPPSLIVSDARSEIVRSHHSHEHSDSISLRSLNRPISRTAEEEQNMLTAVELAPVDRGKGAWTFVVCALVMEMIAFGLPNSFGVFQVYYLSHPPFNSASEAVINSIGTISLALLYFLVPITMTVYQRYKSKSTTIQFCSIICASGSLLLAGFANTAWQLILLQGVAYGTVAAFLYAPVLMFITEWFVERRALAASIIFSGSAVGGTIFPFVIDILLQKIHFRGTMFVLAAVVGVCSLVCLPGLRPRIPAAPVTGPGPRSARVHANNYVDYSFVKSPLFIIFSLTIMAQSFGYFPVPFYISSYAISAGMSNLTATLSLAVFNLSTVVGQLISGYICDRYGYARLVVVSSLASALAAYFIWGFAHSAGVIFAFAVVFGILSGGFSVTFFGASTDVAGPNNLAQANMIMSVLGAVKGMAVIGGPMLSAALRQTSPSGSKVPTYGGYGFTPIILFVGSVLVATSFGGIISMSLRSRALRAV